ncbi:MAG TPA: class D sortase [Bryobacteraceae bacterium]|jgi:sortase A|nr:class D sortase [Bryobacteraceae bacterium]
MQPAGPVLVRIEEKRTAKPSRFVSLLRTVLLLAGIGCIGHYGYEVGNEYVYQAYENWAFDQQIAGRPPVTFFDYLREQTPLGVVIHNHPSPPQPVSAVRPKAEPAPIRPATGTVLGRVEIPRLRLSAMVREGVDAGTLSRAVGHVPSTSLGGQRGNFAIAAHRDTLFRGLKDIRLGDVVAFETPKERYSYEVFSTRIVKPSEVSVLRADGGFSSARGHLVPVADRPNHLLTMITCYPFYYVGSAPQRFIVQAKLISSSNRTAQSD